MLHRATTALGRTALLAGVATLFACATEQDAPPDAGRVDASATASDASAKDAGVLPARDASARDASARDASARDASARDASVRDAGHDASETTDSGPLADSSVPDCELGARTCVGDTLVECDGIGLGAPTRVLDDCASRGEVCENGECSVPFCWGETDCINGALYRCERRGLDARFLESCEAAGKLCQQDGAQGHCVPRCRPGQPVCRDQVLATCNTEGTGPASGGHDCEEDGLVCDQASASCAPKVCEPNRTRCQKREIFQCDANGARETLLTTCLGSQLCEQHATSAYCIDGSCTAGTPVCNGTVATVCGSDGLYAEGGTDCSKLDQRACVAGVCRLKVCRPGAWGCQTGQVAQRCNASGTGFEAATTCVDAAHCSRGSCASDVCTANTKDCVGEATGTCDGFGAGLLSDAIDCAETSQVCDAEAECVAEVIDTIDDASSSFGFGAVGNTYLVRKSRHLTRIQVYVGVTGNVPITWLVYEGESWQELTKIFASSATHVGDGELALVDSGPISVPLVAGRTYFIGLDVDAQGSVEWRTGDEPTYRNLSFGFCYGSDGAFRDVPLSARSNTVSSIEYARLTTAP